MFSVYAHLYIQLRESINSHRDINTLSQACCSCHMFQFMRKSTSQSQTHTPVLNPDWYVSWRMEGGKDCGLSVAASTNHKYARCT